MKLQEKTLEIVRRLKEQYTDPGTALNFKTPFELLVNKVTGSLFKKYRSVKDFASVSPEILESDMRSINFYRTKAKNIHGAAKLILEKFKSEVPRTMDDLTSLPGVARKTANIVLFSAYGMNEGIAVDTHVKRLSERLGLTKNDDPSKIEADLMSLVPRSEWGTLTHLLISHGRKICQAKKPKHKECVLYDICPSRNI